jgi:RNA polymerase sigma-70 factor (ECF subfamily)
MDSEQEEKELIRRAKNDIQAFGRLYDKYYSQIFGYVLRRTANICIAQDLTSEIFLKALKNIKQFQWRGIPFSAWLYRIASHEIATAFRKNKRRQLLTQEIMNQADTYGISVEAEIALAEEELQKHEDFLAIHNSISKLPVKYQEVIVLRFFEKKQLEEIGDILGKREGTVKSLLHRGMEKLKKIVEQNATF